MKICFKCNNLLNVEVISFRDECPFCGADLHVCLNCKYYDTSKHNSCSEPQADYVREKDRANYCEYFKFLESNEKKERKSPREEAEKIWKTIFKKDGK